MAGLLGDGQKFKRRDKDDKVGGGAGGGEIVTFCPLCM